MKTSTIVVGIIVLLLIAGGIYWVNKSPVPIINEQNQSTATTLNIDIKYPSFLPAELKIKVGDTVVWTNQDSMSHVLGSMGSSEIRSPILNKGMTYSHTFTTAGTFNYFCAVHPNMKAKIIVE